jgi:mRNA interferase MazF
MNRGSVWWVDLEPARGTEIQKTRPAIIVSNDFANRSINRVVVIPLTTNVKTFYAGNAFVTINGIQNKAMADQIRAVDKSRLTNKISELSFEDMQAIDKAIKIHLDLK